jgi:C4-dicarboxylate-specific signal transduction histidine kinase
MSITATSGMSADLLKSSAFWPSRLNPFDAGKDGDMIRRIPIGDATPGARSLVVRHEPPCPSVIPSPAQAFQRIVVSQLLSALAGLYLENVQLHAELDRERHGRLIAEDVLRARDAALQTERRQIERALQNTQAELAHVVRIATMGELVASIGHELRQPLAALVMSAESGLKWLQADTPDLDKARWAFELIAQQGMRAGELMQGVQRLVKKSSPVLDEVCINDIISKVLVLTGSERQMREVGLCTQLADGNLPVLGDGIHLQQVVLNLIMNGIEATQLVSHRPRMLAISSERLEPDRILVTVEDNGAGIDPENADRIFDSFFTTKPEGMGMGLAICRSIAEAHGGRLWASSRQPHGAAFSLTLPVCKRDADSTR